MVTYTHFLTTSIKFQFLLAINLNISHSSKMKQHIQNSKTYRNPFVGYIYRLWNYIRRIKRKFQNPKINTNVHISKILPFKTSTLCHFL